MDHWKSKWRSIEYTDFGGEPEYSKKLLEIKRAESFDINNKYTVLTICALAYFSTSWDGLAIQLEEVKI